NQLFRQRLRPGLITIGVTDLEGPVLTFGVSEVSHPLQESIKNTLSARLGASDQTADHGACQSLSESRERPRRRAAEQRDELASSHARHGGLPPSRIAVASACHRRGQHVHGARLNWCLPTKADTLPSGGLWIHEIKHDGFRIIARKNG